MQNFRNYYATLGVTQDATGEDIKRAFRRLARQYHPDLNPDNKAAEERFKALGEAYEVLSDPVRRAQYDEFSHFWKQKGFQAKGRRRTPSAPWPTAGRTATTSRAATRTAPPPSDRAPEPTPDQMDYSEFADFNNFVDRLLDRRNSRPSPPPEPGSRDYFRPGTTRTAYTVKPKAPRNAEARLTIPLETAYAGGRERIRLEDGRSLEVNMPPGLVSGQRIRLREQGVDGGDLYIRITVAPHALFQLDGVDVLCPVPVTPAEAVLGSAIEVPTLDGWVKMNLPQGVRHGTRLRLSGKGYPINRDRRGDQIVEIQIALPTQLSDEETLLYQQLRDRETFKPRANLPI